MMLQDVDVLLLDIEGTITDIAFVQKVLFPYVRKNLRPYLEFHWSEEETRNDLEALRQLSQSEYEKGDHAIVQFPANTEFSSAEPALLDIVISNIKHWMDADKKLGALKQLQGHMWRHAYQSGLIKGHLFPDVIPSLRRILAERHGIQIYIYSSGSVLAQKLLFTYSCEGDVTQLLSGYFDTTIGAKTEVSSYKSIAANIGVDIGRILFLTDVEREAYPAKEAGCKVALVVRDGNAALTEKGREDFQIIYSLNELF